MTLALYLPLAVLYRDRAVARLRYYTCNEPGCPELTEGGGYCPRHRRPTGNGWSGSTGTTRNRSTGMSGWEASRLAAMALRQWPLCGSCGARPSVQADHPIPVKWGGDPKVLRGICDPCHKRKTSEEAALGRRYRGRVPSDEVIAHATRWSYAGNTRGAID